MNFTPAQLDNHAIAILADEVDALPDGVAVEPSEFTNNSAVLVRWAEPQHTSVVGKHVFIAYHPNTPAPFSIARTVAQHLGTSHTPVRDHELRERFCAELAEAIEWIITDDPRF